ncbi:FAD-dependent oxidoreductase [Pendulispora rubella]|uniref:FAD-dependent oxidoreductase n=1 Tax=Pendulispora rubella TaxID=2741070 RepID=A0ABZ2KX26_9BACT
MPLPPTFEVRLTEKRQLSPAVRELTFERHDGAPFAFEAGQWISLILPRPDGEIRRSYSIASPPSPTPSFQLAITHVEGGPGSTYLHDLAPGSLLRAVGPQGFFTRPLDKTGPSLFVATGTGVTPLRSMMHAAKTAGHTLPMWLVFGVRHEDDILYRDEFEALVREHANIRFLPTLSRGSEMWGGRRGYVQTHIPELWSELAGLGLGLPHTYICGLKRMVSTVRDLLRKELNATREQVHSERYD